MMQPYLRLLTLLICLIFAPLTMAGSANNMPTILVFGDSLSAAYRMPEADGWVSLLAQHIKNNKLPYKVANASVSGETTAGGLSRFVAALKQYQPGIVIIELGTNDGLHGLSLEQMQTNLKTMVLASQQIGAQVLLLGTKVPPYYGLLYSKQFEQNYLTIAHQYKTGLVPAFLDNIAEHADLLQDSLHPTAQAQVKVLDNIWPTLKPMLSRRSE
jgi:acyl-CoA thioesterase I